MAQPGERSSVVMTAVNIFREQFIHRMYQQRSPGCAIDSRFVAVVAIVLCCRPLCCGGGAASYFAQYWQGCFRSLSIKNKNVQTKSPPQGSSEDKLLLVLLVLSCARLLAIKAIVFAGGAVPYVVQC